MDNLDEGQAQAHLVALAERATSWAERKAANDGFSVGSGSPLAGDDESSPAFLLSHALITSIGAAIDHMHALYALVLKTGFLHLNAPATVARGALECASIAIWIAEPARRNDRIWRALCWYGQDAKDGDKAAVGAGLSVPTPLQDRIAKFNAVAIARGLDPKAIKNGFSSTEAVTSAKDFLGPDQMDVLLMWRLCSGFAHGRTWPVLGFADNVQTPVPGRPGRITLRSENSFQRVLAMAIAGDQAVAGAIRLFDTRARGR